MFCKFGVVGVFLLRNGSLCCVYRCLNVPSVSPRQFFPVSSLSVVTLAL